MLDYSEQILGPFKKLHFYECPPYLLSLERMKRSRRDGVAASDRIRQSTKQRRPRWKEGFARWNGDVRRGRVDETKAAADELTEVDAVAKGGDDRGLGEGFGGVGDPKIGAEKRNEASDHDPLSPKTMKQLMTRQPRRWATETGGEAPNRRGRRTRLRTAPRRGRRRSLDFFCFYLRSAREE